MKHTHILDAALWALAVCGALLGALVSLLIPPAKRVAIRGLS